MPRSTLQDALDSTIPECLNLISTDPRVVKKVNQACQRLIPRGHWIGTIQNYIVAVTSPNVVNQTITLPPQFATMEGLAICRRPAPTRPIWFMYNGNGDGTSRSSDTSNCVSQAIHIGNFCTFRDIVPSGKKLRFQCDLLSDVGKKVTAIGLDDNGNIIRSLQGSVWADGEVITLAQSPGTLSSNNFSQLVDVQLTPRNGQVWCYQWDGVTNTLIGQFQSWETRPSYRRYIIPILANQTATTPYIELAGKMNFIPVINPTDYLSIGNLEAVRLAAMAVKAEEEHMWSEAALLMNGGVDKKMGVVIEGAIPILDAELAHFNGSAEVPSIQVVGSYPGGGEAVEQLL